jgi:uncharacterized protein (DUF2141 family)
VTSRSGKSTWLTVSLMLLALLRFTVCEVAPRCIPLTLLFVSSCADERPPSGGRKDSLPPKMVFADPPNKSVNFKGDKIEIRFQEYIQPTLDPKEIIISPPLDKNQKIAVIGKKLMVRFKSKLKDSTTYTINFGDAVKDINEGNIYKNFTYVFATGPILDSAGIYGQLSNIADPKAIDDIIVSLYPADTINGILHSRPYYFAKTDKSGNFKISNVHAGSYNVYGLKDQNLNYIYDQADELIGYIDTAITLTDSSKVKINLNVFQPINTKPKFQDAISLNPGKVLITYNAPVKTLKLDADILSKKDLVEIYEHKDSIIYWYSNPYAKKAVLHLVANDSISDSSRVDLKYYNPDSTNNYKKYSLSFESQVVKQDTNHKNVASKPVLSPFKPLILNLSRPVESIDPNKSLVIVNDSTNKKDSVDFLLDDKTMRQITIHYKQLEKASYTLVVPDSTFRDIFGWWNKAFYYKWNSDIYENYGNIILSLKITHPEKYYIFKILDQDNNPISTFYYVGNQERKITIKNVKAGTYHLQAIDDTNKNGEWDSGDFTKKIQPENIINFKQSYELKGNWDLDIDVTL